MKSAFFLVALPVGTALLTTAFFLLPLSWGLLPGKDVLHSTESRYQNLYVLREGDILTLRAGSLLSRSSAVDLADPSRLVLEYTRMMMLGTAYVHEPKSMLMVGLGGGSLSTYLRRYFPEARIVNVEFDPEVPPLAEEYFGFTPDETMDVVVMDGRRFLRETAQRFDIIFLDAFHGGYIPFHLMTREFLEIVREHLNPEGVVVSNTWQGQRLSERETATYAAVFGDFDNYLGTASTNRIIVARRDGRTRSKEEVAKRMAEAQERYRFRDIDLRELFADHYRPVDHVSGAPPLTDDHAPVNLLVGRPSEEGPE